MHHTRRFLGFNAAHCNIRYEIFTRFLFEGGYILFHPCVAYLRAAIQGTARKYGISGRISCGRPASLVASPLRSDYPSYAPAEVCVEVSGHMCRLCVL